MAKTYIGIDLFGQAPEGSLVEVTQILNGNGPVRQYYSPSELPDISSGAVDFYFGVALRKRPGATKDDILATKALWVDIDTPSPPRATFPPSAVVFSGNGWHYYYLLDEYAYDVEKVEVANKTLADGLDGDSCHNCNRLLRIPGTINSKNGTICELRQVPGHAYALQDFTVLANLDAKTCHKIRTGDRRGYGGKDVHKSRSERDWAIIEALVVAGASDKLILHLYVTQPCGDKFRDPNTNGKEYLEHTIGAVREKAVRLTAKRKVYGDIIEGENGYYVERSRGRQRLSTFTFTPEILLEGDEDALVGSIKASGHTWKDVVLTRSAFNDRRALDKQLPVAAWVWLGRDDDVRALLPYLVKQLEDVGLPKARSTKVLGRHGSYWVGPSQTLDVEGVYTGRDSPIVYLRTGREVPRVRYTGGVLPDLQLLTQVNTPDVIWPVLSWFMVTPYKTMLEERGYKFPVLNLFGTRGSGKTSLIKLMQKLIGYERPAIYDCGTTQFVLLSLLGSTNALPISFGEFRADSKRAEQFLQYVRLAYDTGHDPRGRSDQTTIDYPLIAPFTVDGEDILNDAAAKERIIAVPMHPDTIREGTSYHEAFKTLLGQPLNGLAKPYIQFTLRADLDELLVGATASVFKAFPATLPDRIRNNLVVCLCGVESMVSFASTMGLELPFPDAAEALGTALNAVYSERLGRGAALGDEFSEFLINTVAMGKHSFYAIVEEGVLWFQLATAFDYWKMRRRASGSTTLDRAAIQAQLLERVGQYVVAPKKVGSRWCYGINLKAAHEVGLDVPDEINTRIVEVTF